MAHPLLARLKRISPGTAAAIASFVTLVVLAVAVAVYASIVGPRRAETAKAAASQETPGGTAAEPKASDAGAAPAPRAREAEGGAFIDRFEGPALDHRWMASDGWSNGDWTSNDWRASQISFTDQGLRIALEKAPEGSEKPLMGGEIRTNAYIRYGYFESRMRMPRGAGVVMGFFTYADRDGPTSPHEIDIEILGRDTKTLEATLHQGGGSTGKRLALPFDAADGFHTYGFEWKPDGVRWYVDGELIHEEIEGRALKIDRPQQLMISLWGSQKLNRWVGNIDMGKAPWNLDVACAAYAPKYEGKQLCAG